MSAEEPSAAYLAESKVTLLYAFYSLPIPLEVFSTLFRLYIKGGPGRGSLAFDDFLIIFATIVSIGVCVSGLVYGPPYGLGRHIEAVPQEDVQMLLKGDYIFSHFYNMAIATTKLSVLALYHRIFVIPKFRAVVVGISVFVCAWIIVMEVVLGLGCRPIRAWWGAPDLEPGDFTCVDKVAFTYFTNVCNLALDLIIFSMPIPVILRLRVTKDRRISLLFLFSIGLGTCAISAARLSFVFGVSDPDFTWYIASLGILSAWEPCGGILCANLPLVYRSILHGFTNLRSISTRRRPSHPSDGQSSSGTGDSKRSSKPVLFNDWQKLEGGVGGAGGPLGAAKNHTVSEIFADKRKKGRKGDKEGGYEMDETLVDGKIVVQRTLHQDLDL